MIQEKHLTIREAKNEIKKAENELDLYLTKKKINFNKTQPGAISLKDVMVDSSRNIFDKYTHYVIKDEEYDLKIIGLQETINAYEKYIIEEIKRMTQTDEIGLICYLKEEEKKSWTEIDKLLHRSDGYSKVKYCRYKTKKCN